MGPGIITNDTAEKEKEFLACIENVYPRTRTYFRGIQILKDGRIICYDYKEEIKIYKYIDKKFILDFEFAVENEDKVSATSLYEIEENIILIGSYKNLFLYDIRNKEAKLLQKIENDFMNYFSQIIELSNGLIATHNSHNIIFYIYDRENKKLEKKDEIISLNLSKIFETKNGDIIAFSGREIIVYGKDKSIHSKMNPNIDFPQFNFLEGKYILISYKKENLNEFYVDVYDINKFILKQTLEVKYNLSKFIKLNDNLLIADDYYGNIHELNIDNNYELSVKDIFKAHECPISQMCKFEDNKILSISHDGNVKLWEFN